ncbi:MAG TPA: glycosyltransferase family 87 protein, partial [bacterium]|nr:glycosyltransferase family 87 protein [bacterium]
SFKSFSPFLGFFLALASLVSIIVAGRSAVMESGDFQYNSAHVGSIDFNAFLASARYLWNGYNIYDPAVYHKYGLEMPYLPNSFVFFFPFLPLSLSLSRWIWLILNLLFTVLMAREISGLFLERKHSFLLAGLIICSAPWGNMIHFGHCTLWSLYFFLLAIRWDRQNRPLLSGLAIALCLLKYALTGPMLLYFLVYRRSWKNVSVAAGIHAVIFGFFCLYLKLSPWELFMGPLRLARDINASSYGYLDLYMFWYRVMGGPMPYLYLLSVLVVAGAWVWLLYKKRQKDDLGMLALTTMTVLTVLYHNFYDYVGALVPLAWVLEKFRPSRQWAVPVIGLSLLWVLYVSQHYFEFFPHMEWLMVFMKSDSYLIFLSLLWYLGLGLLWFQLKPSGVEGKLTA